MCYLWLGDFKPLLEAASSGTFWSEVFVPKDSEDVLDCPALNLRKFNVYNLHV